nr:GNAT family N-acetyltransferase [Actinoplanes sp. TFC3]
MTFRYEWRAPFDSSALTALHAAAFGIGAVPEDWDVRVQNHSLGWVCAFAGQALIGFVNVPWDGGRHAFLVDTVVSRAFQGNGVGTALVKVAADAARTAGCEWLHVDFVPELSAFYLGACGFRPTAAGLLAL